MQLTQPPIIFRPMRQGEETLVVDLVLAVFDEFVAPQYAQEGVQEFKKFVNSDALIQRLKAGNIVLVAVSGQSINGVIEMRENSHVALLFVKKSHQRQGIAKELIRRSIGICRKRNPNLTSITVNASPNAFEAYKKCGFHGIGREKVKNGIRFIPMELALDHGENGESL